MNAAAMLSMGAVAILLLFFLGWAWAVKINNYSLVDAVWAFSIGLTGLFWLTVGSAGSKQWVAAMLVLIWSARLGIHLSKRIRKLHPTEESRYQKLREHWSGREKSMFFAFFEGQAISVLMLALPFFFIGRDGGGFGTWEVVGAAVSLLAIFGETLADHQMTAFRNRSGNSGAVCNVGLWRYSRHPNYFFEFLIWVGFYIYACGSQSGWMMVHAPILILFLLLRVTGVPTSEASSLASKGDRYRRYQQTTSVFIPLPPRNSGSL